MIQVNQVSQVSPAVACFPPQPPYYPQDCLVGVYTYIYTYAYTYIYIYIYRERERAGDDPGYVTANTIIKNERFPTIILHVC